MSTKHSFTIIGEFFPEVYPAFRSEKWTRGEEDPLTTEMRLFSACLRWSYSGDRTKGGNPNLKITVDVAKAFGKPLAMETLSFDRGRLDQGKVFNRMSSQFPYAMVLQALIRRAVKENVGYKQVPPQHTSIIGRLKYEKKYGVPVHSAAALVIGRRAMGFRERITREVRDFVLRVKERRKPAGNPLPKEGSGMTRQVEAALQELETKLHWHNGLARWQQESFFSCWRELKILALAFR